MGMNRMRVFLVFLCLWAAVTEAQYAKYKDPKQPLNVRIKDLMKRMTLEEKIGQMTQIERKVASSDVMKQYFIGNNTFFLIFRQDPFFFGMFDLYIARLNRVFGFWNLSLFIKKSFNLFE